MIDIKSKEEIKIMQKGGSILREVLFVLMEHAKPGVSELELDALAEKMIRERGAEPGFQRVPGWKHAICISTNDVVVHGIPTNYKLQEGDVVGIDCGVFLDGFNTDMSDTVRVESGELKIEKDEEVEKFLETGKHALNEAIKVAVIGNRVGHISKKIQEIVEKEAGYSVVRSLIGHGVGRELHEEPEIPGYLVDNIEKTPLLKKGMTIAVEVIYNMGSPDVMIDQDGWTIRTQDGSIAGLYERTIAITNNGPLVLT